MKVSHFFDLDAKSKMKNKKAGMTGKKTGPEKKNRSHLNRNLNSGTQTGSEEILKANQKPAASFQNQGSASAEEKSGKQGQDKFRTYSEVDVARNRRKLKNRPAASRFLTYLFSDLPRI